MNSVSAVFTEGVGEAVEPLGVIIARLLVQRGLANVVTQQVASAAEGGETSERGAERSPGYALAGQSMPGSTIRTAV